MYFSIDYAGRRATRDDSLVQLILEGRWKKRVTIATSLVHRKSIVDSMQSLLPLSSSFQSNPTQTSYHGAWMWSVTCFRGKGALIDKTVLDVLTFLRLRDRVPFCDVLHHSFHCLPCCYAGVPVWAPQIVQNLKKKKKKLSHQSSLCILYYSTHASNWFYVSIIPADRVDKRCLDSHALMPTSWATCMLC